MRPKPKILVVDDDYAFAEFAQLLLESCGYEALVSLNAQKGLELAASEQPALILMDLIMKEMDGAEAIRRLKADPTTQKIPVIVCSMTRSEADLAKSVALGATNYIRKPLKKEALVKLIQKTLSQEAP